MSLGPDRPVGVAIESAIKLIPDSVPVVAVGPVLEVAFTGIGVRDVAHGLGVAPDGVWVLLQAGGTVVAAQVHLWSASVAWLQASAANTRARLCFFKLQEGAITHVA